MRDFRINLIFEGSSEIMRLFIAREAVDHHFKLAFPIVSPDSSLGERVKAAAKSAPFYATWYPSRWLPRATSYGEFGSLAKHLRFAERRARKLGRTLFHAMVRFGPRLERKQMVLFRAVDIGAELFAIAASCVRAQMLAKQGNTKAVALADLFCREARVRVDALFDRFYGENDSAIYRVAQQVLRGEHAWLEQGIASPIEPEAQAEGDEATSVEKGEPAGVARQLHAITASGDRTRRLGGVRAPTVVIHGSRDPLVRPAAGRALARAIPGARLELIDGMGHDLPPALWQRIADLLAENANRAAARETARAA